MFDTETPKPQGRVEQADAYVQSARGCNALRMNKKALHDAQQVRQARIRADTMARDAMRATVFDDE